MTGDAFLKTSARLTHTHSCFNHIDDIVAQFLTFTHDIHVHSTDGIRILVVVHCIDILIAQLVAIVVNLVFDIE